MCTFKQQLASFLMLDDSLRGHPRTCRPGCRGTKRGTIRGITRRAPSSQTPRVRVTPFTCKRLTLISRCTIFLEWRKTRAASSLRRSNRTCCCERRQRKSEKKEKRCRRGASLALTLPPGKRGGSECRPQGKQETAPASIHLTHRQQRTTVSRSAPGEQPPDPIPLPASTTP